jgi:hypothetical protein
VKRLLAVATLAGMLTPAIASSLVARPAGAANGPVEGFALFPGQPPNEYSRIASTGANTVYLDVYYQADSPNANSVEYVDGGTTPDASIIADIQKANNAGMKVALMPKIWCKGCPYGWRGDIQPQDPHAFMESYTQEVTHYAQLGRDNGLWLLFLGSEMNGLQMYGDDWRQLAGAVRQTGFKGPISYQPNWDRTDSVAFWDALTFVSVSAYFPLTSTPSPSVAELKAAWHSSQVSAWQGQDWFATIQNLARSTGKNVLIGEVGYRSSNMAAEHPWMESDQQTPDQATQANAYQALLETFSPQPWWLGVLWWQWRGTDQDSGNTDMSPKGKQAEQLLTKWWRDGWRPTAASDGTPTSAGTAPGKAAAVLGARTAGTGARPGGAAPTSPASSSTTQAGAAVTAPEDPGSLVNGVGSAAALGPRSVANKSGHGSGSRAVLVGIALVGLVGMGAAGLNLARIRLRTPRPRF